MWANAYLRPARPIQLPDATKSKFLPDSDYARAKSVDWAKLESVQNAFTERYLAEVRQCILVFRFAEHSCNDQ
jgi:putative spermidine/putrescine transport system substrate-binding protein